MPWPIEVLPGLEQILAEELIPKYQRAVVEAFPDIAQQAMLQAAAGRLARTRPRHHVGGIMADLGQMVSGSRDADHARAAGRRSGVR